MKSPDTDEFSQLLVEEAVRMVDLAAERNLTLRIHGSVAFRLHCPKYSKYLDLLGRASNDIDLASYSEQDRGIRELVSQLGFLATDSSVGAAMTGRSIFWKGGPKNVKLEIYWDKLEMNHTVNFRNRLEFDRPTIPLCEMLEQKLQIVRLTMKDVMDTVILLLEHPWARSHANRDVIELSLILDRISSDWGIYNTFVTNLNKIDGHLADIPVLSKEEKAIVGDRIQSMHGALESEPKSLGWKLRARLGPAKKWYTEVD